LVTLLLVASTEYIDPAITRCVQAFIIFRELKEDLLQLIKGESFTKTE